MQPQESGRLNAHSSEADAVAKCLAALVAARARMYRLHGELMRAERMVPTLENHLYPTASGGVYAVVSLHGAGADRRMITWTVSLTAHQGRFDVAGTVSAEVKPGEDEREVLACGRSADTAEEAARLLADFADRVCGHPV